MNKHTRTFKLQLAKRYLEDETVSFRDLASQEGVDAAALGYWVKLVRHHGDQAFSFPYKNYSIREASAYFHLPDPCIVRRWLRKWEKRGRDAFDSNEMRALTMTPKPPNQHKKLEDMTPEELRAHAAYLEMENAYLKKLRALVQEESSPNRSKRK